MAKGKHQKGGDPNQGKPPAKTAADLCKEHGHRKKHPYPSYPMNRKWWIHWECERGCGQSGEDETAPPK